MGIPAARGCEYTGDVKTEREDKSELDGVTLQNISPLKQVLHMCCIRKPVFVSLSPQKASGLVSVQQRGRNRKIEKQKNKSSSLSISLLQVSEPRRRNRNLNEKQITLQSLE